MIPVLEKVLEIEDEDEDADSWSSRTPSGSHFSQHSSDDLAHSSEDFNKGSPQFSTVKRDSKIIEKERVLFRTIQEPTENNTEEETSLIKFKNPF